MDIQVDDPQLAAFLETQEKDVEVQTTPETTATPETNPAEETAREEKPAEEPKADPKSTEDDSETIAEDEHGKKYIPEKRFKDVYAKLKEAERRLAERQSVPDELPVPPLKPADKTDAIESELLRTKYTQFDPESDQYDQVLDQMAGQIYRANPGITKTEAARKAIALQKQIAEKVTEVRQEARLVKAVQADSGITSRTKTSGSESLDPESMTLEQKEAYLKANGLW